MDYKRDKTANEMFNDSEVTGRKMTDKEYFDQAFDEMMGLFKKFWLDTEFVGDAWRKYLYLRFTPQNLRWCANEVVQTYRGSHWPAISELFWAKRSLDMRKRTYEAQRRSEGFLEYCPEFDAEKAATTTKNAERLRKALDGELATTGSDYLNNDYQSPVQPKDKQAGKVKVAQGDEELAKCVVDYLNNSKPLKKGESYGVVDGKLEIPYPTEETTTGEAVAAKVDKAIRSGYAVSLTSNEAAMLRAYIKEFYELKNPSYELTDKGKVVIDKEDEL